MEIMIIFVVANFISPILHITINTHYVSSSSPNRY